MKTFKRYNFSLNVNLKSLNVTTPLAFYKAVMSKCILCSIDLLKFISYSFC